MPKLVKDGDSLVEGEQWFGSVDRADDGHHVDVGNDGVLPDSLDCSVKLAIHAPPRLPAKLSSQ
ncbi:hypothetical protein [Corynebacterium sp. CCM 9204]|uniref:hypothetical protein n=1 Tax=Corynebacterium sp. CCM 9204 TaxID=3057616 RepID=UPI00352637B0